MNDKFDSADRQAWIEPEITVLEIDETQLVPGVGSDRSIFPDCTQS